MDYLLVYNWDITAISVSPNFRVLEANCAKNRENVFDSDILLGFPVNTLKFWSVIYFLNVCNF